jgi:hypothetical protein
VGDKFDDQASLRSAALNAEVAGKVSDLGTSSTVHELFVAWMLFTVFLIGWRRMLLSHFVQHGFVEATQQDDYSILLIYAPQMRRSTEA